MMVMVVTTAPMMMAFFHRIARADEMLRRFVMPVRHAVVMAGFERVGLFRRWLGRVEVG